MCAISSEYQSDSQFAYWDYPVALWAQQNPQSFTAARAGTPQSAASNPNFSLASPPAGSQIPWGLPFQAFVNYQPSLGIKSVSYYLNGGFVGISAQPPYMVAVKPSEHGNMTLKAVADTNTGPIEANVSFVVQ